MTRVNRGDIGACADCGAPIARHSKAHLYCPDCSAKRSILRHRAWGRANPESPEKAARRATERKSRIVEYGAEVNARVKTGIGYAASAPVGLAWYVRIRAPFSYAMSKNHIYTMRVDGHVKLREESRASRDGLTLLLRNAIASGGHKPTTGKIWIDLLVQKPDHRGDAINVIDLACDAIKDAIGVDDRWFAIRRLDWEVVKDAPTLFVGVGQEHTDPRLLCSYCGRILPYDAFSFNASIPSGRSRACRECSTLGNYTVQVEDEEFVDEDE